MNIVELNCDINCISASEFLKDSGKASKTLSKVTDDRQLPVRFCVHRLYELQMGDIPVYRSWKIVSITIIVIVT